MTIESTLWNYIRDHVKSVDWIRVENGLCSPGTPDVNWCYQSHEGWFELKHRETVPWQGTIVFPDGLRTDQKIWMDRRFNHGGTVFIVAGVGREVFFVNGGFAFQFNTWDIKVLRERSTMVLRRGDRGFEARVHNLMRGRPHDEVQTRRTRPVRSRAAPDPGRNRS